LKSTCLSGIQALRTQILISSRPESNPMLFPLGSCAFAHECGSTVPKYRRILSCINKRRIVRVYRNSLHGLVLSCAHEYNSFRIEFSCRHILLIPLIVYNQCVFFSMSRCQTAGLPCWLNSEIIWRPPDSG
jgi:hypothetical protein